MDWYVKEFDDSTSYIFTIFMSSVSGSVPREQTGSAEELTKLAGELQLRGFPPFPPEKWSRSRTRRSSSPAGCSPAKSSGPRGFTTCSAIFVVNHLQLHDVKLSHESWWFIQKPFLLI